MFIPPSISPESIRPEEGPEVPPFYVRTRQGTQRRTWFPAHRSFPRIDVKHSRPRVTRACRFRGAVSDCGMRESIFPSSSSRRTVPRFFSHERTQFLPRKSRALYADGHLTSALPLAGSIQNPLDVDYVVDKQHSFIMIIPKKNRKIVYQYLFRGECGCRVGEKTHRLRKEKVPSHDRCRFSKKTKKLFIFIGYPSPGERSSLTLRFPSLLSLFPTSSSPPFCRRGCHLCQEGLQPSGSPRDQGGAQPAGA